MFGIKFKTKLKIATFKIIFMENYNRFNHIMVDLETFGTESNSIILSISAMAFDPRTGDVLNDNYFDSHINVDSCVDVGLSFDPNTVFWWMEQSEIARKKIIEGQKNSSSTLYTTLTSFSRWINSFGFDVYIWGNSPRFDLGLLQCAYNKCKIKIPWKYSNELDVRTIIRFAPEIKKNEINTGVSHSGIDDCEFQISYLYKTLKELNLTNKI